MVKNNPLLQQLKVCLDYGEVMPNIPQMSRFFSSLGSALQIATNGRVTAESGRATGTGAGRVLRRDGRLTPWP